MLNGQKLQGPQTAAEVNRMLKEKGLESRWAKANAKITLVNIFLSLWFLNQTFIKFKYRIFISKFNQWSLAIKVCFCEIMQIIKFKCNQCRLHLHTTYCFGEMTVRWFSNHSYCTMQPNGLEKLSRNSNNLKLWIG